MYKYLFCVHTRNTNDWFKSGWAMTQSAVWWSLVRLGRCLAQVLFLLESTLAKKHSLSLRRKLFSEKVQRGQMGQNWPSWSNWQFGIIWDPFGPHWYIGRHAIFGPKMLMLTALINTKWHKWRQSNLDSKSGGMWVVGGGVCVRILFFRFRNQVPQEERRGFGFFYALSIKLYPI